ncbi:MAG: hypothetical protein Q8M58_07090, partial [Anaerolineales bacterium]|nr:hypothetical protein [Anaerolineales bacterium]
METLKQRLFDIVHAKRAFKIVAFLLGIVALIAMIALFGKSIFVSQTGGLATLYPTPTHATPHPVLGDLRVRQGIAHCINRAELIHSVYPWLEDTMPFEMTSFVPFGHWA